MPTPTPLVHPLTDTEAKGEAKKLFTQLANSTGKVPQWMRVMANCEDTLIGFFTLFKSVMDDAPADKTLKWKVAYRVSELNKCAFCISVSKLKLKELGIKDKELTQIDQAANEKEKVALEYAAATTLHAYKLDKNLLDQMKKRFSDEEIVEITSVIGLFNFINRFNDALGVLPEIQS